LEFCCPRYIYICSFLNLWCCFKSHFRCVVGMVYIYIYLLHWIDVWLHLWFVLWMYLLVCLHPSCTLLCLVICVVILGMLYKSSIPMLDLIEVFEHNVRIVFISFVSTTLLEYCYVMLCKVVFNVEKELVFRKPSWVCNIIGEYPFK
jgi:hypothetical protein